jgi:FlaG/FlaF family flagellin (archaellin)
LTLTPGRRKATSVVIASVILVTVTIILAIAVANWTGGVSKQYTKYEKVEIQSATCTWNATDTHWKITLKLKNAGSSSSTLVTAFINDDEILNYGLDTVSPGSTSTNMTASTTLTSGASTTVNIYIDQGYATLSTRTVINVRIHCAGGAEYIKSIELP